MAQIHIPDPETGPEWVSSTSPGAAFVWNVVTQFLPRVVPSFNMNMLGIRFSNSMEWTPRSKGQRVLPPDLDQQVILQRWGPKEGQEMRK